ncbi:DUF4954 family protein [Agriterribacter sp.]|uniref:DUF4954 family protein n=1 Tax=Agriterribacter sp. TaxID=2821509 RepID=UPI002B749D1E|nr:DUF4954 family protein [Agriterribacter sp.]HRO45467.1 DUF4954 family protein [Agriterribacter sp.]HRQ18884.1 DUF4954 family protein [Agriterribacter sp.]
MNQINKKAIDSLGYNFITSEYLPEGKDEYHLRNIQNRNGIQYRGLTAWEIEVLVRNRNTSDDWNKLLVSDAFNPELVKNCKFFGLVRIGKLEAYYLEYHNLRMPVGLYNSTIISCDFGDNVVVDNVNYLSHYIIGSEVILVNIHELATTSAAKFGNGIIKEGESENIRIWLEICNENGGRKVIPFTRMLPGDAWLWSKYRDDEVLLEKFKWFTQKEYDVQRGYYGKIGDRTIIKNTSIIKDVWIGSDAYIKGANKLKNLTVNSSPEATSQIGEGCEMVNGIIGFGCKAFYGVKAIRFIMASHSQLKYGARLINSYLGNNSTISCCEVLNSLIFPSHEQHHNNSFLCAATVMGQSNMAAGATIGSNHNSRSPDGELVAGRGFWPGLCVSLKHNSKFASFNILAKGDYPYELNIPLPFALVSNDLTKDQLIVMPAYWFMYNLYAIARNEWKYNDRDARIEKDQRIEFDALAPDTINELLNALQLLALYTGKSFSERKEPGKQIPDKAYIKTGKKLLETKDKIIDELEIVAEGLENSDRKTVIIKVQQAYTIFKELVIYYGAVQLIKQFLENGFKNFSSFIKQLPAAPKRNEWINVGGQLIPEQEVEKFRKHVRSGKIKSWDDVHAFYAMQGQAYDTDKFEHALAALLEVSGISATAFTPEVLKKILLQSVQIKTWLTEGIYESRAKDYTNPFRTMVFDTKEEMDKVWGKLEDNSFIALQQAELSGFKKKVNALIKDLKL